MESYTRETRMEPGGTLGEFRATLATNGEASDGHILDIRTLRTPNPLPMLFGHMSSAEAPVIGSIVSPKRETDGDMARLRVSGRINLNGDPAIDALVGIRTGIAQLVHDGDLSAMSIRWRGEGVARVNLPRDHYAFVDAAKAQGAQRWGLFFEKAESLEGSIVAIGADPKALIGRADASEGADRAFWQAAARQAEEPKLNGFADLAECFQALGEAVSSLRKAGCSDVDIVNALDANLDISGMVRCSYGEAGRHSALVPRALYDDLRGESIAALHEALRLRSEASAPTVESDDWWEDLGDEPEVEAAEREDHSPEAESPGPQDLSEHDQKNTRAPTFGEMPAEEAMRGLASAMGDAARQAVREALGRIR